MGGAYKVLMVDRGPCREVLYGVCERCSNPDCPGWAIQFFRDDGEIRRFLSENPEILQAGGLRTAEAKWKQVRRWSKNLGLGVHSGADGYIFVPVFMLPGDWGGGGLFRMGRD